MRLRTATTLPLVAAIAIAGGVALGGCGSSSSGATTPASQVSTGDAMKGEG